MRGFLLFILAIVISFLPGAIGLIFTPMGHSNTWFNGLAQSVLTPAPWVFSFAWTVLYALLGIALFLIIVNPASRAAKQKSYWLFACQMALNALWSYVFFGMQMPIAGLIILFLLLLVSVWMSRAFFRVSRSASYLVWPYIAWLFLATYLNFTIIYLNY